MSKKGAEQIIKQLMVNKKKKGSKELSKEDELIISEYFSNSFRFEVRIKLRTNKE